MRLFEPFKFLLNLTNQILMMQRVIFECLWRSVNSFHWHFFCNDCVCGLTLMHFACFPVKTLRQRRQISFFKLEVCMIPVHIPACSKTCKQLWNSSSASQSVNRTEHFTGFQTAKTRWVWTNIVESIGLRSEEITGRTFWRVLSSGGEAESNTLPHTVDASVASWLLSIQLVNWLSRAFKHRRSNGHIPVNYSLSEHTSDNSQGLNSALHNHLQPVFKNKRQKRPYKCLFVKMFTPKSLVSNS